MPPPQSSLPPRVPLSPALAPQLFPLIDTNRDLLLSLEELQHHLYANGVAIAHRRADSEFADFDVNKDGACVLLKLLIGASFACLFWLHGCQL